MWFIPEKQDSRALMVLGSQEGPPREIGPATAMAVLHRVKVSRAR